MPTKTQQTAQFAPSGMNAYNQLQPGMANTLSGYISNPFSNPFFQTQQQLGTQQAQNLGGTQMSNITNNLTASGFGGSQSSPMALEMMQNQGRANTGLQAQMGFLSPVQNALQLQQNALGTAAGYRPLQTGQTQQVSGLGSWLPQVISGALGALNPASGLFGGGGGGGSSPFSMGMPFPSGTNWMGQTSQSPNYPSATPPNMGTPPFFGGGVPQYGQGPL